MKCYERPRTIVKKVNCYEALKNHISFLNVFISLTTEFDIAQF